VTAPQNGNNLYAMPASSQHERLAALIRDSSCTVALTGAGISVPSGIPDFRSPGTGLWADVDPMEVAHISVFRREPERFWSFYGRRFAMLRDKVPNPAHHALVALQRRGLLGPVITQNIDGLHEAAGTRDLIEVHGSIAHASCPYDGQRLSLDEVRARLEAAPDGVPRCGSGHALKPDVVLFGEMLPEAAIMRAFALAGEADLLLCVGSSLEVHPVAGLPEITLTSGGQVAIVTAGPTPYDGDAAVKLDGDVAVELPAVVAAV
jgi:NAD-dependent deacetylase